MKNEYEDDKLKFIEKISQELAGYDSASLSKEMDCAQFLWELELQEHPEQAKAVMDNAEAGFSRLWACIQETESAGGATRGRDSKEGCLEEAGEAAEAVSDMPENEYQTTAEQTAGEASDEGIIRESAAGEGHTRSGRTGGESAGNNLILVTDNENSTAEAMTEGSHGERHRTTAKSGMSFPKPIVIRKKTLRRVAVLTAAAMILGVGGMASVARQGYRMAEYPEQYEKQRRYIVRNNAEIVFQESEIEETYKQISDVCNIKVLALDYIPKDMKLEDFLLTDDRGVITLCYADKKIHLEQRVLKAKNTVSILTMDRKQENMIQNDWLDKTLYLDENPLKSGAVEYSIQFDTDSASYYLSGIMEKDEFIEVAENLYFWN